MMSNEDIIWIRVAKKTLSKKLKAWVSVCSQLLVSCFNQIGLIAVVVLLNPTILKTRFVYRGNLSNLYS